MDGCKISYSDIHCGRVCKNDILEPSGDWSGKLHVEYYTATKNAEHYEIMYAFMSY